MFEDRVDAGKQLAKVLSDYKDDGSAILLALPRGGVVVADEIRKELNLPLDLIVPRKIGDELNPEYAIGAITETGEVVWNEAERARSNPEYLEKAIEDEKKEAKRRLDLYRGDCAPRNLKDKIAIIVDDGVATGLTMMAAVKTAKAEQPAKLIVAVPHGARDSLDQIRKEVDGVIALDEPIMYYAVGAYYKVFDQTEDDEVTKIMKGV